MSPSVEYLRSRLCTDCRHFNMTRGEGSPGSSWCSSVCCSHPKLVKINPVWGFNETKASEQREGDGTNDHCGRQGVFFEAR